MHRTKPSSGQPTPCPPSFIQTVYPTVTSPKPVQQHHIHQTATHQSHYRVVRNNQPTPHTSLSHMHSHHANVHYHDITTTQPYITMTDPRSNTSQNSHTSYQLQPHLAVYP
eukprot:GHVQ01028509.1.p1 GENE.GHVQ01028509.1~~GHVQ01028509.1.p1  ORF type:complete len:111 (+),score=21.53 GHVQ01028509.1:185-517(+)